MSAYATSSVEVLSSSREPDIGFGESLWRLRKCDGEGGRTTVPVANPRV